MAFTGLTLFAGTTGAALVSDEWLRTAWGTNAKLRALLAVTVQWFGVL